MSIEHKCENCINSNCECNCKTLNECFEVDRFCPSEELVRHDERNKIITLLKSDLENFDGLADECYESNCLSHLDEMKEYIAISKYIKGTIELLEKEQ